MMAGRKRSGGWAWGARGAPKKAKSVAAQVTRLQRQVALLKPEVKHFVGLANFVNVTAAAGAIQNLNEVAGGSGISDRVGDVIRSKSIEVIMNQGSVTAGSIVRFIVVKDSQNGAIAPSISGAAISVLTSASPTLAMLNPTARPRFKVLYDQIHVRPLITYGQYTSEVRRWGMQLNFPINFVGSAASAYGKNSLWLIVLTNDAAGTMDVTAEYDIGFTDV